MKTAIVYDRVNKWGGAEKVLLALNKIFPKAPLYTSVYNPETAKWADVFPDIIPSFLNKVPLLRDKHEYLAPVMPLAFESFDFEGYDLVISVTSEAAKGIITGPNTTHICYCLTPTRYLWSGYDDYFSSELMRFVSLPLVKYLRAWDKIASNRPDHMIAISTEVQDRIMNYYNRESEIIYPPVDTKKFKNAINKPQLNTKLKTTNKKGRRDSIASPQNDRQDEYYLIVSRLVSYKKVDLAVKVFNKLGKRLVVIGTGNEMNKIRRLAKDNIEIKGFVDEAKLITYYQNARAFIFPQLEDFGITALEAQASGVPVIAFRGGGALDTVEEDMTGVFFDKQDVDSIIDAVGRFEKLDFSGNYISNRSEMFSEENFILDFKSFIDRVLSS